ncbi:DUF805 domain-containing protein [Rhodosalinus sediminis]|uniref:DUF805 domain-containing protein n=1 Tax=Rhodosalinus sediminis TaxID=1940533 RepID=UPI0023556076|nr:DUF805 domain-containing protein [Rhodosalinus sediminis]
MSFGDAVRTCLRKYVTFSGRASRPEYWWFALFVVLGDLVLGAVDDALFGTRRVAGAGAPRAPSVLSGLFSLAMIPPLLAAGWRRMHDSGRSGLHLVYPLIVMAGIASFAAVARGLDPLFSGAPEAVFTDLAGLVLGVAAIVFVLSPFLVIWWLTRPSEPGPNRFGPAPAEARA